MLLMENGRTGCRMTVRVIRSIVLVIMLLMAATGAEGALRIGNTLPTMTLPALAGAPVRIPESLRGKVVVLHFWAIGCSSCREEMPAMDLLYGTYRKKGLEVLAVNVGQRKEAVRSFASELKISYPILLDEEKKSAGLYEVTGVPRTYVIDRNGVIRYKIIGGATMETLKKLVLSLL